MRINFALVALFLAAVGWLVAPVDLGSIVCAAEPVPAPAAAPAPAVAPLPALPPLGGEPDLGAAVEHAVEAVPAVEAVVAEPEKPHAVAQATRAGLQVAQDLGAPVEVGGAGALAWFIALFTSKAMKKAKVRKGTRDIVVPLVAALVTGAAAVAVTGTLGPAAAAIAGTGYVVARLLHVAGGMRPAKTVE